MERTKKFTFRRAAALVLALVMTLSVMTVMALAAEPLPSYTGDWVNFRNSDTNMGITDAKTPTNADEALMKWAVKYGTGWSAAPTPPIIVNGDLYIQSGKNVMRLSKTNGEILAKSEDLVGSAGYAMNPVVYADGMIFVLVGTQIQALRADTLESLWVTEKMKGMQLVSPITYHDGHVYTGTWGRETGTGYYYCFDVTDDDPDSTTELKAPVWELEKTGGFYWAGSYATDNFVVFGSDDGTSEGDPSANGTLFSVKPQEAGAENESTGNPSAVVIDKIEGIKGDIRSTVSAVKNDDGTDTLYCTTKGGLLISVKINADGTFVRDSYKTTDLGGMSTGTPLVYDGSLFVGVCGPVQFGSEGHAFKVYDAETLDLITQVATLGYVQTSSLLSTGYVNENGKVYVYYTYNNNPGGIYVMEYDTAAKQGTSSVLFTPPAAQQQYCICSLVCDKDGTIYYKNDSCYVMAVARNTVYATDITVGYDDGGETTIDGFAASTLDYELTAPANSKQATVDVDVNDGSTVTINGKSAPAVIDLTEGKNEVEIVVTGEASTRTYTLSIDNPSASKPTDNTGLKTLLVTNMNRMDAGICTLTPAFNAADPSSTYLVTGVNSGFARLFLAAADSNASVKVYAVSGLGSRTSIISDSNNEIRITDGFPNKYYSIYFVDDTTPACVRIEVTGRYGSTQNYFLTCVKGSTYTAIKQTENVKVYLAGSQRVAIDSLSVSDTNNNGAVSVGETVFTAHIGNPYPVNVAMMMFATTDGKITKLFGTVVDPANVGMFVNDSKVETTETPLAANDRVVVFTYSDTENHTDKYTYFENTANTAAGDSGVVKLLGVDYAGNIAPLAGAAINVYTDSACKNALTGANVTDNGDGTYTISAPDGTATEAGTTLYLRSATNGSTIVVPADCTLTLKADSAASAVVAQIAALGNVTADSKDAVEAARTAYNALTSDQKTLVSNYDVLVAAEEKLENLKDVAAVEAKIEALSTDITLSDEAAVKEARKAYKALTKQQKDLVGNLEKLEAAEEAIASLKQIDAVEKQIAALADATADDAAAIAAARRAYEALTPEQQAQVSNLDVLEAAEAKVSDQGAAEVVEDLIASIGTVTKESGDAISEARAAYDALTDAQKDLVSNLDVLEAAEKEYHSMTTGTSKVQDVDRDNTKKDEPETTDSDNGFVDVSKNSWYYDAVNAAVSSGLMTGTGNDRFSPNAAVTRGMIVTILARMDGENTAGTPWYAAGRTWAMTNAISDGTNMTGTLTREQLAAMLYRYAQFKGYDVDTTNTLTGYADAASVSAYALDAMRWANGIGLIQGRNGRLAPQGTASRAELATILDRFMTIFG